MMAGQVTLHRSVSLRHGPQACPGFVKPSRSSQALRFQRQSKPHTVSDDFHFKCSKNAVGLVRFQKTCCTFQAVSSNPARLCAGNRLDPSTSNRTSAKPEVTLVQRCWTAIEALPRVHSRPSPGFSLAHASARRQSSVAAVMWLLFFFEVGPLPPTPRRP
jgi:hypothetical protein